MTTTINWFEIPVANMDRAAKFYGALLDIELPRGDFGKVPHAFFRNHDAMIGALVHDPQNKPSGQGNVVYFGSDDIEAAIARVRELGVEVLLAKTDIGDPGFIALLRDSEGNRVGIHTPRTR
ncbi:MAG TPA: VOC family protein [Polyangiales bacterium]